MIYLFCHIRTNPFNPILQIQITNSNSNSTPNRFQLPPLIPNPQFDLHSLPFLLLTNNHNQIEQDYPLQDASSHITNTGRMVEEQELKMRNLLQDVYFGKTRDVVHDLRSVESLEQARRQRMLQKELVGLIRK